MVFVIRLAVFVIAFSVCEKTRAVLALQTNCQAAAKPGEASAAPCIADYTSAVEFTCPEGISGEWRRWYGSDNNSVLCNGDIGGSCNYTGGGGRLWYSDNGLYFCQDVKQQLKYFVNLSVLAPPMLKNPPPLHIHACSREKNYCVTNDMLRYVHDQVTLSAVFYSPLPVTFELSHNKSKINCTALEYCTLHVSNTAISITLDSLHFQGNRSDPGLYSFNISNAMGYNISETNLDLQCETPPNPIPQTESKTVTLTTNTSASLSCKLAMKQGYYLYMCLVEENVTIDEDNFDAYTNSCAWCTWEQCFSMLNRPTWNFTETQNSSSPYCSQFIITAYIPSASISDNDMKLICAWGDDVDQFTCNGCTKFHLKVEPLRGGGGGVQPYVYAAASVGGVAVVICGMVGVGLVVGVVVRRKKPVKHKSKRRRRQQLRGSQQSRATRLIEESSSDADDESVAIIGSHAIRQSYNAIPPQDVQNPPHTGCLDYGTEVPPAESDIPELPPRDEPVRDV